MFKRVKDKMLLVRRKSSMMPGADSADDQNLSELSSSSPINSDIGEEDSCEDIDSSEEEKHATDLEGPTLIAVDDGRGGIKHVRVSRPPDAQQSDERSICGPEEADANNVDAFHSKKSTGHPEPGEPSVTDMLKKEFKGRQLIHLETDAERLRKRIVSKKGAVHIGRSHLERKQKQKMFIDFFNTMLDMRWRYVLLVFSLSFILSWLGFAVIWYLILLIRGDFEEDHLPDKQEGGAKWKPCVWAMYDFASCFLFSIETQHTIGYGSRQTTEKCPEAIITMSIQSVIGVMIQACMVGTIFAKLARPKKRSEAVLFSRNAVVCLRDGHLCLCARFANMRSSHLVECHVRAILVSRKVTEEGEVIPYYQTELSVGSDLEGEEEAVFFIWPTTVVHRIDEDSPFWNMSARDFVKKRFEVIITLEGIVEPTGNTFQARTSYLPNEILWGHRFVNILNYKRKEGVYKVDYGSFNTLFKVPETPTCSAKTLRERSCGKREGSRSPNRTPATSPKMTPARVMRLRAGEVAPPARLTPQIRFITETQGDKVAKDKNHTAKD